MKITKLGHALALAGVLSLGAAFSLDVQAAEYKPKAEVKALYEGALTGVDGKTVIIKHFYATGRICWREAFPSR